MTSTSNPPWSKVSGSEGTIEIVKEGDSKYKWIPKDMKIGATVYTE